MTCSSQTVAVKFEVFPWRSRVFLHLFFRVFLSGSKVGIWLQPYATKFRNSDSDWHRPNSSQKEAIIFRTGMMKPARYAPPTKYSTRRIPPTQRNKGGRSGGVLTSFDWIDGLNHWVSLPFFFFLILLVGFACPFSGIKWRPPGRANPTKKN